MSASHMRACGGSTRQAPTFVQEGGTGNRLVRVSESLTHNLPSISVVRAREDTAAVRLFGTLRRETGWFPLFA